MKDCEKIPLAKIEYSFLISHDAQVHFKSVEVLTIFFNIEKKETGSFAMYSTWPFIYLFYVNDIKPLQTKSNIFTDKIFFHRDRT